MLVNQIQLLNFWVPSINCYFSLFTQTNLLANQSIITNFDIVFNPSIAKKKLLDVCSLGFGYKQTQGNTQERLRICVSSRCLVLVYVGETHSYFISFWV